MTTATAMPRRAYAPTAGRWDALAGTGTLIRFILRRDRVRLPVWILAIALSVMGSVASFADTYPTAADRQARADVMGNAVAKLFTGPGYGLDNYTYGAMTANELLPLTAVAVALMSIFLVVRHTRAEEESGRADLVRATVVGRHASTAATLTVVGGANVLLCGLLTIGLPASLQGLSTTGSLAFAAALLGVGFVFAGVGVLAAQVSTNARGATGLAGMILGAAYLVRAIGDLGNGTLSWFSPFGWATQMRAYVDDRWWPLLLSIGTSIVVTAVAVRISARRDLGAGLIADRPGPAAASSRLRSPFGLALRLQRATLLWWSVSLFLLGLVYGGVAKEASKLYEDVDAIDKYLVRVGNAAAADQYLALTLFISALIAVGYAIQSASRPRGEEAASRAEPVLAAAVSRGRFVGSHLAMALGGSVILLFAYGLGAGITRSISVHDAAELPRLVGSALAYAPALWVFVGLVAALFGLAPRAIGAVWAAFGAFAFIGFLGPLLKLPDWVYNLSPLEHIPRLPVADFTLTPIVGLALIAAGLIGVGLAGFSRRDIGGG
jgi:ABC-2 type transport system permease protein